MATPLQKNTFKFMSIRPPQLSSKKEQGRNFIRASEDGRPATALQMRLVQTDELAERRKIAAEFVASDDYVSGLDASAAWLTPLRKAGDLIKAADGTDDLAELREALTSIREENPLLFDATDVDSGRNKLWDSLYSAYVSPGTKPHDRGQIMQAIRILYVVAQPDALDSSEELARRMGRRVLVPRELISHDASQSASACENEERGDAVAQRLDAINAIRREILEIDAASKEVTTAELSAIRSLTSTSSRQVETQWRISDQAIVDLGGPARMVLERAGINPESTSLVDTVNSLTEQKQNLYAQLKELGGVAALAPVDETRPDLSADDLMVGKDDLSPPVIDTDRAVIRPIGFGDLIVVKDTLKRYQEGELSYVENVLASEKKERVYRRLDRTETTTTVSTESTEESERDLQTTERYELQSSTAETIQTDSASSVGITVSGSYGPTIEAETSAEFSTGTSTSNSQSAASSYAMDVTDRSITRITESVKEEISTTLLTEIEETNTHGFDNQSPDASHVIGMYRWLEKVYDLQLYTYGKRQMFEFILPEPAAFYVFAKELETASEANAAPPEPLPSWLTGYDSVTDSNYKELAATYGATVSQPPASLLITGKAYGQAEIPSTTANVQTPIKGEEGYLPASVWASGGRFYDSTPDRAVPLRHRRRLTLDFVPSYDDGYGRRIRRELARLDRCNERGHTCSDQCAEHHMLRHHPQRVDVSHVDRIPSLAS